ncbi:uncharacterized protein LOC141614149 [Silene latifolia]|uniref:uncharacterized protein LOC141614149 n=1 Tax=Silene latifolia TaxID=37657 RepID=UPI003D7819D8
MIISSWNIRGLNDPIKQMEVRSYLAINKVEVLGLLETRVKSNKFDVISRTFPLYSIMNNYSHHYNGRIWVLWDNRKFTVLSSHVHDQLIHLELLHYISHEKIFVTFIYASNDASHRERLWDELRGLASSVTHWIVMGDFNIVREMDERIEPNPPPVSEILAFNQCLLDCTLEDINSFGCEHTWTNKRESHDRVWSILDRVLTNPSWLVHYPSTHVQILPAGISDHSPLLVDIHETYVIRRKFSYLNCWEEHQNYRPTVQQAWDIPVKGNQMLKFFFQIEEC